MRKVLIGEVLLRLDEFKTKEIQFLSTENEIIRLEEMSIRLEKRRELEKLAVELHKLKIGYLVTEYNSMSLDNPLQLISMIMRMIKNDTCK